LYFFFAFFLFWRVMIIICIMEIKLNDFDVRGAADGKRTLRRVQHSRISRPPAKTPTTEEAGNSEAKPCPR
jgi:hypothetical protein